MIAKSELPSHWDVVPLRELAEQDRETVDPESEQADRLPYLGLGDIESETGAIASEAKEVREGKGQSTTYYFDERHVLYCKLRPYLNKVSLPNYEGRCSTELIPFLPRGGVDRKYLAWLLRRPETVAYAMRGKTGSRMPRTSMRSLMQMEVPRPPHEEQIEIADAIEDHMQQIDAARAATAAQIEAAEALPDAYLREIFESPEAESWPTKRLGEVADIHAGLTKGRTKKRGVDYREMPYLRVANVQDGYLDLSEVKTIPASEEEIEECQLQYGDLLLTEGGDPDKLGRGTYWQNEISICLHQNHIFRVRFDLDEFSPAYVSAQIGSRYGKKYFLSHAKQTTGIATINQTVLRNFPLKVLPFERQQEIAENYEKKKATAKQITEALEDQMNAVNNLPASVLQEAFCGQLLSSHRTSEPSIAK